MAPCNGTTSTPLKLVVTPTLQWHPAMAPRHSPNPLSPSTLQWHPAMAPHPLSQSWPSPSPPNNIAHYNGTLQWHLMMAPSNGTTSTAPCNGTLVPRPIRQSGSSPSPSIGSKNPYSYRYLGKKKRPLFPASNMAHFFRVYQHQKNKLKSVG